MFILLWFVVILSSLRSMYPPQGYEDIFMFYSSSFIILAFQLGLWSNFTGPSRILE